MSPHGEVVFWQTDTVATFWFGEPRGAVWWTMRGSVNEQGCLYSLIPTSACNTKSWCKMLDCSWHKLEKSWEWIIGTRCMFGIIYEVWSIKHLHVMFHSSARHQIFGAGVRVERRFSMKMMHTINALQTWWLTAQLCLTSLPATRYMWCLFTGPVDWTGPEWHFFSATAGSVMM